MTTTETVPDVKVCGTDAGYQRHRRRGQVACDECKVARRAKTTEHRRAHGYLYERAERMARMELARQFPAEYAALRERYVTELRRPA